MILHAATSNPGKLAEFRTSASSTTLPGGDHIGDPIQVLALPNLKDIPEPVEDAQTFLGNAEIKAIAYSLAAPGLLVFADDSGLEVDALGGEPGVRSARYAEDAGFTLICHPEEHRDEGPASLAITPGAPGPDSRTQANATARSPGEEETGEMWAGLSTKDARNNALLLARLASLPPTTPRTARFVCALALARDGQVLLRAHGTVEGEILPSPRGTNGFGYDPLFLLPALGLTTAELPPDQKWAHSHRGNAFRHLLTQLPTLQP